ncbi:hypothetical protein V6N11_018518 [Hibiscus sabdariffa]|uniref:Uncharacterized protein n=1 Tax=Hibiscus sabdariffa TaxID=183260 RepID=A0ABR2T8H4_9ROSI
MAATSSAPIKVFLNEEIRKKYEELFASRGMFVHFDYGFINSMLDLPIVYDNHEALANPMTTAKRNKILADLCESCTNWTIAAKGSHLVKDMP